MTLKWSKAAISTVSLPRHPHRLLTLRAVFGSLTPTLVLSFSCFTV